MKLLFDLTAVQPIGNVKYHGGSEYAKQVFFTLLENLAKDTEIICLYNKDIAIEQNVLQKASAYSLELVNIFDIDLAAFIKDRHIDTFYSALSYTRKEKLEGVRYIITIHGLRRLEAPVDFYQIKYVKTKRRKLRILVRLLYYAVQKKRYLDKQRKFYERNLVQKNLEIIVPSYHTKYTLISNYNFLDPSDIGVYYSPLKEQGGKDSLNTALTLDRFNLKKDAYFLLISGNRWVKNVYRVLLACKDIFEERGSTDKKVVIAGVTNKHIYKEFTDDERFVFLDYVSNEELNALYAGAYYFIFPSLSEGFGYPPLEAMKYGTPVLASHAASIPEVCSSAAIYFNPYNHLEIKNRVLESIYEPLMREKLILEAKRRYNEIMKRQKESLRELVLDLQKTK